MKKIITVIAAFVLSACASTQLRTVDGKQQQVFISTVGTFTQPGKTLDEFNAISRPCQQTALNAIDAEGLHKDRYIPFNYAARSRWVDDAAARSVICIEAQGYKLIEKHNVQK